MRDAAFLPRLKRGGFRRTLMNNQQVATLRIHQMRFAYLRSMAEKAMLGGASHVRGEDRGACLLEDQLVGQIGQWAGCVYLFGNDYLYNVSRALANAYPTRGDGGTDIPGLNVDFKASLMRASDNTMDYYLPVRPSERGKGKIYILVLVQLYENKSATAYIVGWATDETLPPVEREGVFRGAHVIKACELNPLPPFKWFGG